MLYAFDLLFLDDEPPWKKPLEERWLALGGIIPKRSAIVLSEDYKGSGADLFLIACENELKGNVSKRLDRTYHSGRSREWLKTKCITTGEFVIIGYLPGTAVRAPLANIKVVTSMASGCAMPARSEPASARLSQRRCAHPLRPPTPLKEIDANCSVAST